MVKYVTVYGWIIWSIPLVLHVHYPLYFAEMSNKKFPIYWQKNYLLALFRSTMQLFIKAKNKWIQKVVELSNSTLE